MITPVFRGKFASGKFQLDQGERERLEQWCRGQKDGLAVLKIARKRKRSMPYHRYFWGVVIAMIARHFQVDMIGAYVMIMSKFRPILDDNGGLHFRGVSSMDAVELIELGTEIRETMLNEYSLKIPEPNEIEMPEWVEVVSRYSP